MLREVPQEQLQVIKHWLDFTQKHRKTLLHGNFKPYYPEAFYPVLEAESAEERIITLYQEGMAIKAGAADREVYILNATGADGLVVDLEAKPRKVEYYDLYGNRVAGKKLSKGVQRAAVPTSGYIKLIY